MHPVFSSLGKYPCFIQTFLSCAIRGDISLQVYLSTEFEFLFHPIPLSFKSLMTVSTSLELACRNTNVLGFLLRK